jgi:hypothetical protein
VWPGYLLQSNKFSFTAIFFAKLPFNRHKIETTKEHHSKIGKITLNLPPKI